jgi:Family of unknown function (DUF6152)
MSNRVIHDAARLLAVAALLCSLPARAHHSFATYDTQRHVTLAGMVTGFQWINPHAWLQMQIVEPNAGAPIQWSFEAPSPSQLARQGWAPDSLKPGDKISVTIFPSRSGQPGGALLSVVDRGGRNLCARECSTGPAA